MLALVVKRSTPCLARSSKRTNEDSRSTDYAACSEVVLQLPPVILERLLTITIDRDDVKLIPTPTFDEHGQPFELGDALIAEVGFRNAPFGEKVEKAARIVFLVAEANNVFDLVIVDVAFRQPLRGMFREGDAGFYGQVLSNTASHRR